MTSQAQSMFHLSLEEIANLIRHGGNKRTVLVQGDMGMGKTSIGKMLDEALPKHTLCYFDCTTKDLGDLMIPMIKAVGDNDFVRFATNEELGLHLQDTPSIIMVDEYGKANPAVKTGLLRLMLERKMGSYTMHPDSIIFATTNLGLEGLGDIVPAHGRNRMTVVTVKKPTPDKWIEWGLNNGIDPSVLGWVRETPQVFQSFTEVNNPDENPYIFHPRSQRAAFVTGRSLEAASDWIKLRAQIGDTALTAALMGTLGDRAAMDMMAFVQLADQLPTLKSIRETPEEAKVPTSASAVCMVVFRALSVMDDALVTPWMKYLMRLDREAQGLFANGVRMRGYSKQGLVMTNASFTQWARNNSHLFAADQE